MVVEQGRFAELNVPGNYIHELQAELYEEGEISHNKNSDNTGSSDASLRPLAAATKAEVDESRKTGDWATYKYYARALGPWYLLLFSSFVAGSSACSAMGSESWSRHTFANDTR